MEVQLEAAFERMRGERWQTRRTRSVAFFRSRQPSHFGEQDIVAHLILVVCRLYERYGWTCNLRRPFEMGRKNNNIITITPTSLDGGCERESDLPG